MMLHIRLLVRELRGSVKQALLFVLCVVLSLMTLVALNSFRRDVNEAILGDARALHGGDIIVHSHYPLNEELQAAIERLGAADEVVRLDTYEFYSVITAVQQPTTLFVNILAVDTGYPLYGRVQLGSGDSFSTLLSAGKVIVAPEILQRLQVDIGDVLHVGEARLTIVDVVLSEPAKPVDMFSLGPRIFVAAADLDLLGLVQKGSRVEYETLLKVQNPEKLDLLATELQQLARPGQERVATYRTARSGIKRFFDNLFFFLSLISVFTLLLAGIGMQSSLAALLRKKHKTLAIIKALGATHQFVFMHYFLLITVLGFLGSCLGVVAGLMMKKYFPLLFGSLVPAQAHLTAAPTDIVEGFVLGFLVVMFFTFIPLYRLKDIKPVAIFRHEVAARKRGVMFYGACFLGVLLFAGLIIRQLDDPTIGIYFVLAASLLIGGVTIITRALLRLSRRLHPSSLALRQALKSLIRPGNATTSVVVTLVSALTILLAIFLVEFNLRSTYIESYPADAPNLFCIDIQKDQKDELQALLGQQVQFYPIIRARLLAINDRLINREQERKKRGDSLAREFNLTHRDTLLPDEKITAGKSLYGRKNETGRIGVSVLDMVADIGQIVVGDILRFNIQGVPLEAEVTSIRTRTKSMLYPFFYFVFPSQYLQDAPQTYFAALHVDKETIPQRIHQIVTTFPNISSINMAATASELGGLMEKLSGIVNFFAFFSVFAGGLILVSSILATQLARIREAVYYKILGSGSGFVLSVFLYENIVLGLLCSCMAVVMAQGASWALCYYIFEIDYTVHWLASASVVCLTTAMVATLGVLSSLSTMRQKPVAFLYDESQL